MPGNALKEETEIPYIGPFPPTRLAVIRTLGTALGSLSISWRDNRRDEQTIDVHRADPPSRPRTPSQPPGGSAIEKVVRDLARQETRTASRSRCATRTGVGAPAVGDNSHVTEVEHAGLLGCCDPGR